MERDAHAQRKYGNAKEGNHKTKSEGGSQTGDEIQKAQGGDPQSQGRNGRFSSGEALAEELRRLVKKAEGGGASPVQRPPATGQSSQHFPDTRLQRAPSSASDAGIGKITETWVPLASD